MATGREIVAHFEAQAAACEELGSPFTARVCRATPRALDGTTAFGARVFSWPGNPKEDVLALRVAGALHRLARSGRAPRVKQAWPPEERGDLAEIIAEAVREHDAWLCPWLDSPPQTNETGRSAILLGGCLEIARRARLPIELLEIGASAGLNLHLDAWRYELGDDRVFGDPSAPVTIRSDWRGAAPNLSAPLEIAARAGVDVAPLDPGSPPDRERLLAYIWADQRERLARTTAALDHAAASVIRVEQMDAGEWLAARLAQPGAPGRVRIVAHTIVWQYLGHETRWRIAESVRRAGARATSEAPLAWLRLEPDGAAPGAAITLTLWPAELADGKDGGTTGGELRLGRGDYHGRWAAWSVER